MTTALEKYAKLEAEAEFHDGGDGPPRDVILSFGARTLVLLGLDEQIVGHWPLASLRALGGRNDRPVQLAPDLVSAERVVLEDPLMIEAIAAVCPSLFAIRRRRRRNLRWLGWLAILAALAVPLAFLFVPALTVRFVPLAPKQMDAPLGLSIATRLAERAWPDGRPPPAQCVDADGLRALRRIQARLSAGQGPGLRVLVIDRPEADAHLLPGGVVLLNRGMIDSARAPEEVAGTLAHLRAHDLHRDGVRAIFRHAGRLDVLALAFGGVFGALDIDAVTRVVLETHGTAEEEGRADEAAFGLLAEVGLPVAPAAAHLARLADAGAGGFPARHGDAPGRAAAATAADRIGTGAFTPVLDDRSWIALGNICDTLAPLRMR